MQGVPLSALAFSSPHTVFGPTVDPVTSRTYVRDRAHDSTISWGKGTRTLDSIDNNTLLNRSEELKNNHSVTSPSKNHRQHDVTSFRISDASRTFSVWANGPPQCREMEMKINDVMVMNNRIREAERMKAEIQGRKKGVSMQDKRGNMMMNEREYEWEKETRRENGNRNERVEDENVRGKKKEREKEKEKAEKAEKEEEEGDDSIIQDPRSLDGLCDEFHHLMRQLEGTGTGTSIHTRTSSKPLSSLLAMSQPISQPMSGISLNRSIDSPRCLKDDIISNQSIERPMHDTACQRTKEQKTFSDHENENCNRNSNEYENKVKIKSDEKKSVGVAKEGEEEDIEGDAMDGITLIDAIKSMTYMQQQRGQEGEQEQGSSQHQILGALQNRISSDIARMRDRLKDQTGEGVVLPVVASSSSSSSSSFSSSTSSSHHHSALFSSSSSSSTHPSYPSSSSVLPSNHLSNRNRSHVPGEGSSFAEHRSIRDNNTGNTISTHGKGRYNTVNQIEFNDFKGDSIDRDGSHSLSGSNQSTEYTGRIVVPFKSGASNADAVAIYDVKKSKIDGRLDAKHCEDNRVRENNDSVGDRQDEDTQLQGIQEDVRYITQKSTVPANQFNRIGSWVESGSRSHHTGTKIRVRKPLHAEGRDRTIEFRNARENKSENENEYERQKNVKMFRVDENVNDNKNNDSFGMGTRRLSKAKHVTKEKKNIQKVQNKEILSRSTRALKQSAERIIDPSSSSSYALPSSSLPSSPSASFPSPSASSFSPSSSPTRAISKHADIEEVKREKKGMRGKDIGGGNRVIASKRSARQSAGEGKGVEVGEEVGNDGEEEGAQGEKIEDEEKDSGKGEDKQINEEEGKKSKEEEKEEGEEALDDKTEENVESRISDESDSEDNDNNDDNNDDNRDNEKLSKENNNKSNNKIKRNARFMRNSTIHATHPTRVSSIRQSFNDFLEADQHSHSHSRNKCAVMTTQDTKQQPRDRSDKGENDGESSTGVEVSTVSVAAKANRYQKKYKAIMTAASGKEDENIGEEKNGGEEREGVNKSGIEKGGSRWKRENDNAYMGRKDFTLRVPSTALKRGSGENNLSRRSVKDRSSKECSVSVAIGGMFIKSYYEEERSRYHQKIDTICSSSSESEGEQWSGWNADSEEEEEEEEEIKLERVEKIKGKIKNKKKGKKEKGLVIEVDSWIGNSDEGDKTYKSAVNRKRGEKKKRVERKKSKINEKESDKIYRETKGVDEEEGDDYDNNNYCNDNEEESSEEMIRYRRGEKDWSDYIRIPRYTESEEQKQEVEVDEDEGEDEGEEENQGEAGELDFEDEGEGKEAGEEESDERRAQKEGSGEPCDVTERYSHWLHKLFYCFYHYVLCLVLSCLVLSCLVLSYLTLMFIYNTM